MTLERVRYFAGQVLGADDFDQEQRYFRDRARRHNRLLHGWGIVCGLDVHPGPGPCEVTIEPGLALDQRGEEIELEEEVVVDLCSEQTARPLYVAVCYAECPARPVALPGDGDETEFSRTRESCAVAVLAGLPATYAAPAEEGACPDLPAEAWVVVAEVVVGPGSELSSLDAATHRRRVALEPA